MKAAILAGGKGTRLKAISGDLPKPMVPLDGLPVLEHQIRLLKDQGFAEICIFTGYRGEQISQYFQDGSPWGVKITWYQEETPLGTSGALAQASQEFTQDFLVLYGDVMVNMNLQNLVRFHQSKQALGTLVVHPNDHPQDSDLLEADQEGRVTGWLAKKNRPQGVYPNLVNAALYVFSPKIFASIGPGKSDFGTDVFPRVLAEGGALWAYRTSEYLKDMGTEDRYAKVERQLKSGFIERRNLKHPQKAVFLDRDGTLNKEVNLLCRQEDMELLPGVAPALKRLNQSSFLAICTTNQPVIARNLCSPEELQGIHNKLESLLGQEGAYLDMIYHCPHHPDRGYPEERVEYKIDCNCRKPKSGMFLQAQEHFNIDFSQSYLVGDRKADILAGQKLGLKTCLVETGHDPQDCLKEVTPDFIFANLELAVEHILRSEEHKDQ